MKNHRKGGGHSTSTRNGPRVQGPSLIDFRPLMNTPTLATALDFRSIKIPLENTLQGERNPRTTPRKTTSSVNRLDGFFLNFFINEPKKADQQNATAGGVCRRQISRRHHHHHNSSNNNNNNNNNNNSRAIELQTMAVAGAAITRRGRSHRYAPRPSMDGGLPLAAAVERRPQGAKLEEEGVGAVGGWVDGPRIQ